MIAAPLTFPIWLVLILTAAPATPELEMPVKPPVVAVEVLLRIILPVMLSVLAAPVLIMQNRLDDEEAPEIAQFNTLLFVMLSVVVDAVAFVSMAVSVADVEALVMVIVLFEIIFVQAIAGADTV